MHAQQGCLPQNPSKFNQTCTTSPRSYEEPDKRKNLKLGPGSKLLARATVVGPGSSAEPRFAGDRQLRQRPGWKQLSGAGQNSWRTLSYAGRVRPAIGGEQPGRRNQQAFASNTA